MNLANFDLAVRLADTRGKAELRQTACVCAAGARWGVELARRAGVGIDQIDQDDLRLIWAGLIVADENGFPNDRARICRLIRTALEADGFWDETDTRPFVTGGFHWSDFSLAALFGGLSSQVAEQRIPVIAGELLNLIHQQQQLATRSEAA